MSSGASSPGVHRRLNPLTGEWVLVSAHRNQRPWQGQLEPLSASLRAEYDEGCYLCPGNARANGESNPNYQQPFVFDNDFAALKFELNAPNAKPSGHDLFQSQAESGICRVICYTPRHDLTLATMGQGQIAHIVEVWAQQTAELGGNESINNVQIFENKGAMMGCSNPHPHGQIWAQRSIPDELIKEMNCQREYYKSHQQTLLSDYLSEELRRQERVVFANNGFVALVPYWAKWPYEVILIAKRPVAHVYELDRAERSDLAEAIRVVTIKLDNLFQCECPYSAGLHQAPTDGQDHPQWHLHMHFYPPLLRSASVKKFMVGYEMFAEAQRDITPELCAKQLRDASSRHYSAQ